MAKLSAHGAIVGTLEYMSKTTRYMSDGKVLVNYGSGWKLKGRLKPGLTPESAYATAKQKLDEQIASQPAYAEYRRQLFEMAGSMAKRARLHTYVSLMPEDPDGVWSHACDSYGDNVDADISDIAELCNTYKSAALEQKS